MKTISKDSESEEQNSRSMTENRESKLEIAKLKEKLKQSESENEQLKLDLSKLKEKVNQLESEQNTLTTTELEIEMKKIKSEKDVSKNAH